MIRDKPPQQDTILETDASRDTNNQPLNSDSLRIITLNCKNIQTCGPFLNDMINRMDICMIQEHWLFNCQIQFLNEIHENLNGIVKSVDDSDPLQPIQMPRGYGGTGILWKKELDHLINVIDIGNERIQCVEFMGSSRKLLIVSVYMPCKGPQNHVLEFQECVDMLYEITQTYGTSHIIVFGGDFNEDIINASNNQRSRYI